MRTNFNTDGFYILFLLAISALLISANNAAVGQTIVFSEGWETPVITDVPIEPVPGLFFPVDMSLPAGWRRRSTSSISYIQPATSRFNELLPISSPADGNQFLVLSGGLPESSGVSIVADVISSDTSYTLSAAIGSTIGTADNSRWGFELWADTDGDALGDVLLGGVNENSLGATNPERGEWALNSFTIDTNDTPEVVGSDLVILLRNITAARTSYFDSVSLSSAVSVPEPASSALVALSCIGICICKRRRNPYR